MLPAERLQGGPRPVGGQLQGRQVGKGALPERQILDRLAALRPFRLPATEIRILNRQGWQGAPLPPQSRCVKSRKLPFEDPQRPAIGDDVVNQQNQQVTVCSDAEQMGSQ